MASTIGIKIANGEFYPIMEENSTIRKRLILTTVHDNQPSVQIDLYRSVSSVMTDAQYIGSLVVEKIKPKPKGEPSIEMVISSSSNGDIIADAIDLDTGAGGEHYVLTVSLKSLDETSRDMELPDFELESNEEPPSSLYKYSEKTKRKKQGSSKMWVFVLIGLIIILGLAAAWLFLLGGLEYFCPEKNTAAESSWYAPKPITQEPVKEQEPVKQPEPVKQTEAVQPKVEPTPVIQAPPPPAAPKQQASRKRPPAPVASYKVPATIPKEGVDYRIRWGDTLWDISEAFYRDPWLYPKIARNNNIRNPDYIISGRTIRIPPKN
jgi:hypothetical protein